MNTVLTLSLLAILGACASQPHQKLLVDSESKFFESESLWKRVSMEKSDHLLKECYQGDLSTFTENARKQYEQQAKSARYWNWVGNCLTWHGELKEARFFLGMALDLSKSNEEKAMVKNNLGVVYQRLGRVSLAYDSFKESHKMAPQFVSPAFNLAQLYLEQNLNQEALKILNNAPFKDAKDAEVVHLKALAYVQLKNLKDAGVHLSQIPSKFHTREDFALTIGQWHLLSGRPQEALSLVKNLKSTGLKIPGQLSERIRRQAEQLVAMSEKK
jgi:tetratricopeptide (TPR) repeat protein